MSDDFEQIDLPQQQTSDTSVPEPTTSAANQVPIPTAMESQRENRDGVRVQSSAHGAGSSSIPGPETQLPAQLRADSSAPVSLVREILAPMAAIAKLHIEGLFQVMPTSRPSEGQGVVKWQHNKVSDDLSLWRLTNQFTIREIRINVRDANNAITVKSDVMKKIPCSIVECDSPMSPHHAEPLLSPMALQLKQLTGAVVVTPGSLGAMTMTNNAFLRQQDGLLQLVDANVGDSGKLLESYDDQMPLMRLISMACLFSSSDEVRRSYNGYNQICYDAKIIDCEMVLPLDVPIIQCLVYVTDIRTAFLMRNNLIEVPGWCGSDFDDSVTVIPFMLTQSNTNALVVQILSYIGNEHFIGKQQYKCTVRSLNNASIEDSLLISHNASLTSLPSAQRGSAHKILLVTESSLNMRATIKLPGNGQTVTRLLKRLNTTAVANPEDIGGYLASWIKAATLDPDVFRSGYTQVFSRMLNTLPRQTVSTAVWMCAELFGKNKLPAVAVPNQQPNDKLVERTVYAYQHASYFNGTKAKWDCSEVPSFGKGIRDQIAAQDGPTSDKIASTFAWMQTSPSGLLPTAGFEAADEKKSAAPEPGVSCYRASTASNMGRMFMYMGGLTTKNSDRHPLMRPTNVLPYLSGACSLLTATYSWLAVESGYSIYDINALSDAPTLGGFSLPQYTYSSMIADPIRAITRGRVDISADAVCQWNQQSGVVIAATHLGLRWQHYYNVWPVPAYVTIWVKAKFAGPHKIQNRTKRLMNPRVLRSAGIAEDSNGIHYHLRSNPLDAVSMLSSWDAVSNTVCIVDQYTNAYVVAPSCYYWFGWTSRAQSESRLSSPGFDMSPIRLESATFVLCKLRATSTNDVDAYSTTFELPCDIYILRSKTRIDATSGAAVIVESELPDPWLDWLSSFLDIGTHALAIGWTVAGGDYASAALMTATTLIPKIVALFETKTTDGHPDTTPRGTEATEGMTLE